MVTSFKNKLYYYNKIHLFFTRKVKYNIPAAFALRQNLSSRVRSIVRRIHDCKCENRNPCTVRPRNMKLGKK